jgi:tripartite-type tricarboxylate transporter receptor subunit TctC
MAALRRTQLGVGIAELAAMLRSGQTPITMILPFPAGGATDAVGRLLAERMRKSLGQPAKPRSTRAYGFVDTDGLRR